MSGDNPDARHADDDSGKPAGDPDHTTDDEGRHWAPWMHRIPPRARRPVAAAMFVGLLLAARLTGFRDWLTEQPVVFAAVPVALLGVWALAHALGPRRWIEKDREKTRRAGFAMGAKLLLKLPATGQRVFFFLFGAGAVTVAVMAVREGG